jgi:hypothetical protein
VNFYPDLPERTLKDIIFKLRMRPRIAALLRAAGTVAQKLENTAYGTSISLDLDLATGDALDTLGSIVGEERSGRDDETYRRGLRASIVANRSNGTRDDLISVADLVLPNTDDDVAYSDIYPAGIQIVVTTNDGANLTAPEGERLVRLLVKAKPAGVALRVVDASSTTNPFLFRSSGQSFDGPGLANLLT